MAPPTWSRSSHLNTSNQDVLINVLIKMAPQRAISQLILNLTKTANEINHHSRPKVGALDSCPHISAPPAAEMEEAWQGLTCLSPHPKMNTLT